MRAAYTKASALAGDPAGTRTIRPPLDARSRACAGARIAPCVRVELERCAAYVAAREALGEAARAGWPGALAERASAAAMEAVTATADSLAHDHGSAARRRRVREALGAALRLAAACDIARAGGHDADGAQRAAGRAIVALALLLHANLYVPNA